MKTGERELKIHDIVSNELLPLLRAKGHDYSGSDVMSNFRDFGWRGVVVRIGDKYHRLKNFICQGTLDIKDETIQDTMIDLINYGFILLLLYRESRGSAANPGIDEE